MPSTDIQNTRITPKINYFQNDKVRNRVISYKNFSNNERCIFVPNWNAKSHHWDAFCSFIAQKFDLDYFETREKPFTTFVNDDINFANNSIASDIIKFINIQGIENYHLILCSFATPLVISHWDELKYKPLSLTLICPITQVKLPWVISLFSKLPKQLLSRLHGFIFIIANQISTLKPLCKNMKEMFKNGDIHAIHKLQYSVQEVLKLSIRISEYSKLTCPTLVVKSVSDNIHNPQVCNKINRIIPDSMLVEVANFKEAHMEGSAKAIYRFLEVQNGALVL